MWWAGGGHVRERWWEGDRKVVGKVVGVEKVVGYM
jgi:hypothetical protein